MAKRTKKTHPERAVLKGSGGEYVVTKVQMLFETTKLLTKNMPSNTTIHLSYEEKVAILPKNLHRILIF